MSRPETHVIVDTNIAKSGCGSAHPTSQACNRLAKVLADPACMTGVFMTPELQREWRQHASATMSRWLAQMESKNRLRRGKDIHAADLETAIAADSQEGVVVAMLKDIHLTAAAIMHGCPVASLDDKQKKHIVRLAERYALAAKIRWFNPEGAADPWENWLRSGCPGAMEYACVPISKACHRMLPRSAG